MPEIEWKMLFDGWAPIIRTLVLGTLGYVSLVLLLRVSGKRTLSKMNAFDFVITVAFGSVLAAMLTSRQVSLMQGVTALALLILLQFVFTSLSVRSNLFKRIIKAQPTLVYFKGQFIDDAMVRQRLTKDDVLAAMRQQSGTTPSEIDAVVLETEGSLSVLRSDIASIDELGDLGVDVGQELADALRSATP